MCGIVSSCASLLEQCPLLLWNMSSRCTGFSSCGRGKATREVLFVFFLMTAIMAGVRWYRGFLFAFPWCIFLFFFFLITAILVGVECCLIVILICIYLTNTNDGEHPYMSELSQHHLLKDYSFPHWTVSTMVKNHLTINIYVYFHTLNSIPLAICLYACATLS